MPTTTRLNMQATATGDITKAPLTITISSVPSINENATDLEKITLTKACKLYTKRRSNS